MSVDPLPPRNPTRSYLWTIAKFGLAVALATIVLLQTNLQDIIATLQRASFRWLVLAALTFFLSVVLLAGRAWHLLGKRVPFRVMLESTVVQTSVGNLVATGAGLIAYVSLLRQQKQAPVAYSIASIILGRVADVLALSMLLGSVTILWPGSGPTRWVALLLCSIGLSTGALTLLALWRHEWLITHIRWIGGLLGLLRFRVIVRAIDLLERLAEDQGTISISAVLCYTAANQVVSWLFFWACLQAFGLALNPWASVLILALIQLVAVAPVQVLGGLGVFDASTIYLLGLFSVSAIVAAPVLVGYRIVFYVCNLLLLLLPLIESRRAVGMAPTNEIR